MHNRLSKITILLADSQEMFRSGVARLLQDENDIRVVAEAATGEEAIQLARNYHPDVVIMDACMPGIGGIDATERMSQLLPGVQVIGLCAVSSGAIPTQMLRAGAKAFLTKNTSIDELIKAVHVVSTGERYVPNEIASYSSVSAFQDPGNNLFRKLSPREREISGLLTEGKKVSQISELLELSPKTVYSYRYRVFEKLGIRSDVELTIAAVRNGYRPDDTGSMNLPGFEKVAI